MATESAVLGIEKALHQVYADEPLTPAIDAWMAHSLKLADDITSQCELLTGDMRASQDRREPLSLEVQTTMRYLQAIQLAIGTALDSVAGEAHKAALRRLALDREAHRAKPLHLVKRATVDPATLRRSRND